MSKNRTNSLGYNFQGSYLFNIENIIFFLSALPGRCEAGGAETVGTDGCEAAAAEG